MDDFKASSKGACFGAGREKAFKAGNTIAKEFFDVQAQASAAAYLCAARFVS